MTAQPVLDLHTDRINLPLWMGMGQGKGKVSSLMVLLLSYIVFQITNENKQLFIKC